MTKITEHPDVQHEAVSRFWRDHGQSAPVRVLFEVNETSGGSLAVEIQGRFLIWEAWGTLTAGVVQQSIEALREACLRTKGSQRPSLFIDMTRVEEIDESACAKIVDFRLSLQGPSGFARAAAVFCDTMPRIMYDMAGVLRPAPWEEHVFPSVEEALMWLGKPKQTGLLHVDGVAWVVSMENA